MLQAILAAIPERGVTLDRSDTAWRVMRRRWKRSPDVYLFFNEGPAESNHTVTLMAAKGVEVSGIRRPER